MDLNDIGKLWSRMGSKERENLWEKLTGSDCLWFEICKQAVQPNSIETLPSWLEADKAQEKRLDPKYGPQYDLLHFRGKDIASMLLMHIHCALLACKVIPSISPPAISSVPINDKAFINDLTAQLGGGPEKKVGRKVATPFALANNGKGYLAEFVFEVIENGSSAVYIHPKQAFTFARMNDEFKKIFTVVPTIPEIADNLKNHDVRVTLKKFGTDELIYGPLYGNSATGAAARGIALALSGKKPDPDLIVLAQVDSNGNLGGVDGIPAKVGAIIGKKSFSTIVIARENREEVEEILKKPPHGKKYKVIPFGTPVGADDFSVDYLIYVNK
jgi:hypothetical protein